MKEILQQGIEKLNILTVLQEEQNLLTRILSIQQKSHIKSTGDEQRQTYSFDKDVNNMRNLSKRLDRQIGNIEKDIRALQLKAKPFNPLDVVEYPSSSNNNGGAGGHVFLAHQQQEDDEDGEHDDEDDSDDDNYDDDDDDSKKAIESSSRGSSML